MNKIKVNDGDQIINFNGLTIELSNNNNIPKVKVSKFSSWPNNYEVEVKVGVRSYVLEVANNEMKEINEWFMTPNGEDDVDWDFNQIYP